MKSGIEWTNATQCDGKYSPSFKSACVYRVFTCARTGAKPRARQTRPVSESSSLVERHPQRECRRPPGGRLSGRPVPPGWQGTGCREEELGSELETRKWEGGGFGAAPT